MVERGVLVLRGSAEDWDGVVAADVLQPAPKALVYGERGNMAGCGAKTAKACAADG